MGPNPIWLSPDEEGKVWTQRDMPTRRMPCYHEGIYQSNTFTSQEMPKIASIPPKASRGAWNRFFLIVLKRNQSLQNLDLRLLSLQNCDVVNLWKLLSFWYFVRATQANKYKCAVFFCLKQKSILHVHMSDENDEFTDTFCSKWHRPFWRKNLKLKIQYLKVKIHIIKVKWLPNLRYRSLIKWNFYLFLWFWKLDRIMYLM